MIKVKSNRSKSQSKTAKTHEDLDTLRGAF